MTQIAIFKHNNEEKTSYQKQAELYLELLNQNYSKEHLRAFEGSTWRFTAVEVRLTTNSKEKTGIFAPKISKWTWEHIYNNVKIIWTPHNFISNSQSVYKITCPRWRQLTTIGSHNLNMTTTKQRFPTPT